MNQFIISCTSSHKSFVLKTLPVIVFLSFVFIISSNIYAQTSDPNIPDTNGVVTSIVSDGQHIYVAGDFTEVGGVPRELVARLLLDGTLDTSWDSPLGGANGGQIQTMSIDTFTQELLIGGFIPSGKTGVDENGTEQMLANRTARIDLSTGAYLGSLTGFPNFNLSGGIIADENFVYVAGSNGQTAKLDRNNNYNSVSWNLSFIGNSSAFHRDGDALYVNAFEIVQGTFSNKNLAKTDLLGTVDESFKPAINRIVNAITTDDNYVYIGGDFTLVNGTSVNYVARLDKTTGQLDESWLPAANGRVYAISLTENHVYIGGTSTLIKVDKTTGANDPDWSASVSNNVNSILVQDEDILIGGNFNFLIDGATVKRNLAKILPSQNFAPFITTWEVASGDLSIYIPTGSYTYDFTIDWGDGTTETISGIDPTPSHTYASAGTYTVEISETFPWMTHLDQADAANATKLITVEQWGDIAWGNMSGMFKNASNLTYNAQDSPDLSSVSDMSFMFDGASSFNGAIGSWDVSNVTNMLLMFKDASSFNQDIGNWDMSKVVITAGMFLGASSFNQDIGNWDVSACTDMTAMFQMASAFNQNIGGWDVSNVFNMNNMFGQATAFNGAIGSWGARTSKVTNMAGMFFQASAFNQDISSWDVSSVTSMQGMFGEATAFNQNIGSWDVSNVTDMNGMFAQATAFNGAIGSWAEKVSNVTNMSAMFFKASTFNQDINNWNVSNVTNMAGMFSEASAFNQPLGSWDVSKVTNMFNMFQAATVFNGAIGTWSEKTSNVTNMAGMFFQAGAFNQKISSWDVSSVTTMQGMFSEASAFNQFLESWDVSKVTNMNNMFQGATAFNQPIGLWDVSNVDNMMGMFFDASAFNQDLSQWNVSRSTDLTGMFGDAIAFNQDLSDWDVSNVTNMSGMLINSGLSTANYDSLLEGWSQLTLQNNVTLDANGLTYSCDDGYAARQSIIDAYGWTFNGDNSIDNVEPTVSVKDITVELDINGQVVITADQIDNGSSDNCTPEAELTFTLSQDTFTEIDTYTVTLTVKDIAGNTAMKDFTVIVEAADISNLTVASITDKTYTGNEIEPTIVVQGGNTTLVEGIDFELTYSNNINVGTATVTISGIGNFSGTTSQTFVIRKAPLTITVDDKQKTYGEANPALTFTYTGLVNSDIKVATEPSISTTATAGSNVGTYPITLIAGSDQNYAITLVNGTLTIGQKALTIIADDKQKVYGEANPALTFSYTGLVNGDEKAATEPSIATTATASSNFGTYPITLIGAADVNYDITLKAGELEVTKSTLTITADNKFKAFGQENPVLSFTYSGLVNGDKKAATEPSIATTATAISNVGTYPITLEGAADANYNITLKAGELEVTKATLTITADNKSKVYGQENPVLSFTYSGLVNGDEKVATEPSISTTATASSNVGIYPIILEGAADTNYDITLKAGELEVTKATLMLTAEDKSKVYGEANPALTFIYSGLVNGDTQVATEPGITTTATASSNVGTYPITLSGGVDANYDITLVDGTLTVGQKAVTITAEDKNKVYGEANQALIFTYTGLVNGDTQVATEPSIATTATVSSNVGTYPITLSGGLDANYDITLVDGTLTVGQKAVTITAENKSKVYGEANPALTFTYSGLVNGDEKLATEPSISTTATASSNVGTYLITLAGDVDANYNITLVDGELEVTQATLTITADEGQSKIFGTADPVLSYSATGFAAGDDEQVLTGTLTRDVGEVIGTYPINLGSLAAGGNYQIVYTSADFEIIPAVIESVMQPAPIETVWGVYPGLPSTVTVMTTDGQFLSLPITWDLQALYVFGNGEYPLTATINLPSGILNTEALTVEIVVTVLPKPAQENILLDNNSFEAEAGQNFIAVGNLTVIDPIDNQHDISLADLAFDNVYFQINNGTLFWNSAERADGRTEFKVLVRVQDRDGNILEKEFTIIRNRTSVSNIEIFNTFTPDGDNVNDTWGIKELRFYDGVRIQIFDRGGERMFYTENPDVRWDGTFKGKELPIGTYYWTIEVGETGEVRKGMLNLLRK